MTNIACDYFTTSQLLNAINKIAILAKEIAEYELEIPESEYSEDHVSDLKHYLYEEVMTQLCGDDYFDKINFR